MNREAITNAKRVVVKIGSSSLTGSAGSELDPHAVQKVVDLAFSLKKRGAEVVVVSSGAIAAGLSPLGLKVRPKDLSTQQAAASVGQGLLIAQYSEKFKEHGVISSQVLLTTEDVVRRSHYANAQQTLSKLLSLGVIPIINENDTVVTDEIKFGDNDRLAALVAVLVDADALVLLSDVDALYDMPPTKPGAKRIDTVPFGADLSGVEVGGSSSTVGTGGAVTKVGAAKLATESGVSVLLTSTDNVSAALEGQAVGTWFESE